jgi:hypothetical protein
VVILKRAVTPVDAQAAVRAWIDGWSRGWPAKDADVIAALYTDDATFVSQPFRQHMPPGDYARWAFEEQDELEFWFGEPIVSENRAAVEYWAVITFEGKPSTLAGISVLRFAPDGLCESQRDYWVMEEGRREPPAGWGR